MMFFLKENRRLSKKSFFRCYFISTINSKQREDFLNKTLCFTEKPSTFFLNSANIRNFVAKHYKTIIYILYGKQIHHRSI